MRTYQPTNARTAPPKCPNCDALMLRLEAENDDCFICPECENSHIPASSIKVLPLPFEQAIAAKYERQLKAQQGQIETLQRKLERSKAELNRINNERRWFRDGLVNLKYILEGGKADKVTMLKLIGLHLYGPQNNSQQGENKNGGK